MRAVSGAVLPDLEGQSELVCKLPSQFLVEQSPLLNNTAQSCLVSGLDQLTAIDNLQIVQLSASLAEAPGQIPSAALMTKKRLFQSSSFKQRPLLIVPENPIEHLTNDLCAQLTQHGFTKASVLAFGLRSWLSADMPFVKSAPGLSQVTVLPATAVQQLLTMQKINTLAVDSKTRDLLLQAKLNHTELPPQNTEAWLAAQMVTQQSQPWVLIANDTWQDLPQWIEQLNLPQLFVLGSSVGELTQTKQFQHWTNQSRKSVKRRFVCEGA